MSDSNKIKVTNYINRPNSVQIYLPKKIRERINGNEIVITETEDGFCIREPVIMDNKRLTIKNGKQVVYTSSTAKELIGEYDIDFKGDFIILTNVELS